MNELALFAGAGGGLLASRLLGWRTVCAVAWNAFAVSVLDARQNDGCLDAFPIWDDVRSFNGHPWNGAIDVVSGGFPCQPFSTASRGRAVAEDRWPDMLRIVREVNPQFVFSENVQRAPIDRAASDLRSELRHSTAVGMFCASGIGCPARRPRWWLVSYADGKGESRRPVDAQVAGLRPVAGLDWWQDDPRPMGVVDALANRMDRLQALGNGQVPAVAALAFTTLARSFN